MNSLSQQDRIDRLRNVQFFDVIDSSVDSLLQQAEAIAAFIHYHDLKGVLDGYFSQFLQDLKTIREKGVENFVPDGNLEPAQALLFAFVKQLHEITGNFNLRWKNYAYWYLQNVLGAQPLPVRNHKICLHFTKTTNGRIRLEKHTGFRLAESDAGAPVYRLDADFTIENTTIEKVISIYFNREKNIKPASDFHFVTALQIKELSAGELTENPLFANNSKPEHTRPLGFILVSPSLLLREGKRCVSLTLERDNEKKLTEKLKILLEDWKRKLADIELSVRSLQNIFYIRISTAESWKVIENYAVKLEGENLLLKFTLPEDFPSTTPCRQEIHDMQADFPALQIYLNYDAWLYPYSWLKYFPLKKIRIKTEVEGINNVQVYNDLGKVDCSKPFQPFGINTEKGALMVIGNYEMSVKHVRLFDVKIHWGQLPEHPQGFKGFYAGYGLPVDNTSFKVQVYYLSDYGWKAGNEYALFGAAPDTPLNRETVLRAINMEKMPVNILAEEDYTYTISSQTGFVSFMLQSPGMGFGEKQYRKVFSEYMLHEVSAKKFFWKRPKIAPNEPYKPIIERITLNYTSEETIDLRKQPSSVFASVYHISPFGDRKIYPTDSENHDISPVFQMDTDANILLALRNVRKGGALNLYFDFLPFNKEIYLDEIPQIKWYLGNGYQWEAIPGESIGPDKTINLLESGFIRFFLPGDLNEALFDENGNIWLRAAIEKHEEIIPCIKKVYINVAEASCHSLTVAGTLWKPEQNIPGISEVRAIASYSGKEQEKPEQLLMRLSEYASHRGKAVTARDYERMTLQHFPDIAKVKCLSAVSVNPDKKGGVTLVIIPVERDVFSQRHRATSRQILKIKEFFVGRTSAAVRFVDVINPLYEGVLVRCRVRFRKRYPVVAGLSCLADLLNKLIAPWQQPGGLPVFDYALDMDVLRQRILEQEFVSEVEALSVIIISEEAEGSYQLYEYGKNDHIIRPSTPFAVFVPAREHLIITNTDTGFGINEMTIGESLVIS
jgi:hypothetical protein